MVNTALYRLSTACQKSAIKIQLYALIMLAALLVTVPSQAFAQAPLPSFPDANLQACFDEQVVVNGWQYAEDVTTIRCEGRDIVTLAEMDKLPNLTGLYLAANQLVDLQPLTLINTLQVLWLTNNSQINVNSLVSVIDQNRGLREIGIGGVPLDAVAPPWPLNELTVLEVLDISNTGIEWLTAFNTPQLRYLDASGNNLSDVMPLNTLPNPQALEVLDLSNNALWDLAPLGAINRLQTLWLSGNSTITSEMLLPFVRQNSSTLTALGIGDIFVGNIVEQDLALNPDLITKLDVSNIGLIDLIVYPHLSYLDASSNEIEHISPLSLLFNPTSLEVLRLADNRITDVSPLQSLNSLQVLWLSNNNGINYSQLEPVVAQNSSTLRELGIGGVELQGNTIPVQAGLISKLDVSNTGLDYLPVYPGLTYLDASDNRIADLSSLTWGIDPQGLTALYLANNQIVDVMPLQNFTQLEVLWLSGNSGIDYMQLQSVIYQNNQTLREVGVGDIYLQGYSVPVYPDVINKLDVSNTGLDYLPVYPGLTYLNASDNQIADLSPLSWGADPQRFTSLYLSNNHIVDVMPLQNFTQLEVLWLSGNSGIDYMQLQSVIYQNNQTLREVGVGDINLQGYSVPVYPDVINKLDVSNTGLDYLPVYPGLTYLDASDNQIVDLSPLSWGADPQRLTSLYLANNQIVDVMPLQNFTQLEVLWLSGNSGINYMQLQPVISQNSWTLRELGLGDIAMDGAWPSVNADIIRKLDVSNTGSWDLFIYPGLTYLDASDNQITDLSPLNWGADPQRLTSLYLANNQIVDVMPLQNFTQLEVLWLSGNSGIDYMQLQPVISQNSWTLRELGVGDINMNGEWPTVNYDVIRKLDMSNTGLWDLPVYPNLTYLNVSNNLITNVNSLSMMNKLQVLWLSGNSGINYNELKFYLQNLTLRELGIGDIQLTTTYFPNNEIDLSQLIKLDISNTGIEGAWGLEGAQNLRILNLSDNYIIDINSILWLERLREVDLRGNQQIPCDQLDTLERRPYIEVVYRPATCTYW